jgi:hypothetical protein
MRHKRISNELRNSIAPDIANAKRKSKGGFDLWKSSDWMISILFPRAIQMAPLALS